MIHLVLLSAPCPGLPLGMLQSSETMIELMELPEGETLVERVGTLAPENKDRTTVVVSLLTDELGASQLQQLKKLLPHLKLIANYAVGYNNIDVAAAKALGIKVSNTPGVLGDATADLTIGLLLMVSRGLFTGALEMHYKGQFPGWSPTYGLGVDLKGKTLGIVGWGEIGRRVASRARALGMSISVLKSLRGQTSPQMSDLWAEEVERIDEKHFLPTVDVLSLHCPLTPQTRHWLNAERLSMLKQDAIVLNTARGDLVDEEALAASLQSGQLFGAGLDVFSGEPVLSQCLQDAPRLVVLPHLGSATRETRAAMGHCVLANVLACEAGAGYLPSEV
ncbi:MAG: hypothetical protein RIR26_1357 [Pseudomonadota bacterium]|jgi:glyoxylate reductase